MLFAALNSENYTHPSEQTSHSNDLNKRVKKSKLFISENWNFCPYVGPRKQNISHWMYGRKWENSSGEAR